MLCAQKSSTQCRSKVKRKELLTRKTAGRRHCPRSNGGDGNSGGREQNSGTAEGGGEDSQTVTGKGTEVMRRTAGRKPNCHRSWDDGARAGAWENRRRTERAREHHTRRFRPPNFGNGRSGDAGASYGGGETNKSLKRGD